MDVQEDILLRREETTGQIRDDGDRPGAGERAEDDTGGGGPHPEHGLPLGDALLPVHGNCHVRRVGAVGLSGQRILLCNLTSQGQENNEKHFILCSPCFVCKYVDFILFFLVH